MMENGFSVSCGRQNAMTLRITVFFYFISQHQNLSRNSNVDFRARDGHVDSKPTETLEILQYVGPELRCPGDFDLLYSS